MRKRIKIQTAELVSSTVVGKEWYLKQLRHSDVQLPVKKRNLATLFSITRNLKNYDESCSTGKGTL